MNFRFLTRFGIDHRGRVSIFGELDVPDVVLTSLPKSIGCRGKITCSVKGVNPLVTGADHSLKKVLALSSFVEQSRAQLLSVK